MKTVVIVILLFCSVSGMSAQYDTQFSQYFMTMNHYNPAYAGTGAGLNLSSIYKIQWVGIPGSPESLNVTVDSPLKLGKANLGVGLIIANEGIGRFQRSFASGQIAYKQKLFGGILSLGMQTVLRIDTIGVDLGLGIYYIHNHFYLGASSMGCFTGGYNIQSGNSFFELQPSFFMKVIKDDVQTNITGRVIYNKKWNGGIGYRTGENAMIVYLGASLGKFNMGYAYDYVTSAMGETTNGSHELIIRYKPDLKRSKAGKYRYKSVRIL